MRDKRKEKVLKEQVLFADGMEIVCPRQEDAFCLKNQEVRRKKTVMATKIAITISFVAIIL
jgi:hypothetical protein